MRKLIDWFAGLLGISFIDGYNDALYDLILQRGFNSRADKELVIKANRFERPSN